MHLQVLFSGENGQCQKTFYPFCGVNEELKMFVQDMLAASKVLLLANHFQINFIISLHQEAFIEITWHFPFEKNPNIWSKLSCLLLQYDIATPRLAVYCNI